MPRKRRKAIITETTPDIPFQKVRVEWVDCVSDSGWANEKELKSILDEYSPLLQDVTADDVKQKVKEKRLPRLKKVSSPSSPTE